MHVELITPVAKLHGKLTGKAAVYRTVFLRKIYALTVLRRCMVRKREALSGASFCFWTRKTRKTARDTLKTEKNACFQKNFDIFLAYSIKLL